MNDSGIYKITCTANGKLYVGSAINFRKRWRNHVVTLKNNCSKCTLLQRGWNKHGAAAFVFSVIELVENKHDLLAREQHWIDFYVAANPAFGYNTAPTAGSGLGLKHTKETREKLSLAAKRRPPHSLEARAKMSAARKGKPHSPEHSANIAKALKGQSIPLAARMKMSAAAKIRVRYPHSAETRAKLSVLMTGRVFTPEWKAKISAGNKGRKQSPESIAKSSASRIGKKQSQETRDKRIATLNLPENKAKMSAGSLARWAKIKLQQVSTPTTLSREEPDHL